MHSGGRHHPPRPAAENPQVARRSAVGDRQRKASRRYTDRCGTFACRTATVASSVNPPERRPSASAATAEGRRAQPGSTAVMARSRDPFGWSRCPPRSGSAAPAGATASARCVRRSTFALFTRAMLAVISGRQPPVVRRRDRRREDGDARRAEGPVSTVLAGVVGAGVPFSECRQSDRSGHISKRCATREDLTQDVGGRYPAARRSETATFSQYGFENAASIGGVRFCPLFPAKITTLASCRHHRSAKKRGAEVQSELQ